MSRVRSLLLLLVGLFCGYLTVEAVMALGLKTPLALVMPAVEPQMGRPDPDTGYAFVPSTSALWTRENRARVEINALGLRDDEVTVEKPAGVFRVALTGDSYTESLQVRHDFTFEALAEKKLHDTEIVNLAMSGNGPLRQLVRLETYGYGLKPDLSVFLFSIGDFLSGELLDDSTSPGYRLDESGEMRRSYGFRERFSQRMHETPPGQVFGFLMRHSHVFRAAYGRMARLRNRPVKPAAAATAEDPCLNDAIAAQLTLWTAHEPDLHWRAAAQFLAELAANSRRTGVPSVVAMKIPMPGPVCGDVLKNRAILAGAIEKELAAKGLIFKDWNVLLYKAVENPEDLSGFGLSLGKGHLNYKGHMIYADILANVIEEQKRGMDF